MAIARWTGYQSADTAVASSSLNGLTDGSYALGAAIDNTRSGGNLGWLYADLEIVFRNGTPADTTITAGSGAPYLGVFILPSLDGGTRYPTTGGGGSAGATAAQHLRHAHAVPASTAVGIIVIPGLILPPGFFKVMLLNKLGVTFPSNNNNLCRIYRYSEEGV